MGFPEEGCECWLCGEGGRAGGERVPAPGGWWGEASVREAGEYRRRALRTTHLLPCAHRGSLGACSV